MLAIAFLVGTWIATLERGGAVSTRTSSSP